MSEFEQVHRPSVPVVVTWTVCRGKDVFVDEYRSFTPYEDDKAKHIDDAHDFYQELLKLDDLYMAHVCYVVRSTDYC